MNIGLTEQLLIMEALEYFLKIDNLKGDLSMSPKTKQRNNASVSVALNKIKNKVPDVSAEDLRAMQVGLLAYKFSLEDKQGSPLATDEYKNQLIAKILEIDDLCDMFDEQLQEWGLT